MSGTPSHGAIGVATSPAEFDLKELISEVCDDHPAATVDELKDLASLIFLDCGISFGPNKINKMARRFSALPLHGSAWAFFLYVTNELALTRDRIRRLLANPDIARAISYSDPTGEQATNRVYYQQQRLNRAR